MKISVCIPTYERPEMLLEALNSVFSQDKQAFEILIGDDDSLSPKVPVAYCWSP
ncbi:glycosyltransferase [Cerasicoccus frondis]|uniref:glycosyltransferase n=1 Tax=Cerasicoccus frondis TaxID=490090 RepID=UPI003CCE3980